MIDMIDEAVMINYRGSAAILVILSLVCAPGCAPEKEKRYHCSDERFSIIIPAQWKVREKIKGTKLLAELPVEGEVSPIKQNVNVLVEDIRAPVGLQQYVDIQIGVLNRTRRIKTFPRNDMLINGVPAVWFTYSNTIQDFGYKAVVYALTRDNKKFYVITGIAEFKKFSKYEAMFREMASSFRFE